MNLEIDAEAYARFSAGLLDEREWLTDHIRFVGEDYGGATLPTTDRYREEAALIVRNLVPILGRFRQLVASTHPLSVAVPDESTLAFLLDPFLRGPKRWLVWASKTLHFLRPDAFPILDSRAEKALGLSRRENLAQYYRTYCEVIRALLISNAGVLTTARDIDKGSSPSDLKLLDKILYELGA
jgi:hypothetical protein